VAQQSADSAALAGDRCDAVLGAARLQPVTLRKADGWQATGPPIADRVVDLADSTDTVTSPEALSAISHHLRDTTPGNWGRHLTELIEKNGFRSPLDARVAPLDATLRRAV
jgi:hypothetical protein